MLFQLREILESQSNAQVRCFYIGVLPVFGQCVQIFGVGWRAVLRNRPMVTEGLKVFS